MKLTLIFAGILLIAQPPSCGERPGAESAQNAQESLAAVMEEVATLDGTKYKGKLDQLLTLDMAAQVAGFPKDKAEIEYNKATENPQYHELAYLWTNGRKRIQDLGFTKIEVDVLERVAISWVGTSTKEMFLGMYRQISEADIQAAKKAMAEKVNAGELDKEAAQLAADLAEGAMENTVREPVEGVGGAAVWVANEKSLKVWHKGLTFALMVDISPDLALNKARAVTLAKLIIAEKLG